MNQTNKPQEDWEKRLREIYETAASTDDKSDFDCLLPSIRNLLSSQKSEILDRVEEMVNKVIGDWAGSGANPEDALDVLLSQLKKIREEK